ncbi:MAG TPA: hypothetical protein VIU82_02420, partial [Bosea sp. (in: a-proteobacteria)]
MNNPKTSSEDRSKADAGADWTPSIAAKAQPLPPTTARAALRHNRIQPPDNATGTRRLRSNCVQSMIGNNVDDLAIIDK